MIFIEQCSKSNLTAAAAAAAVPAATAAAATVATAAAASAAAAAAVAPNDRCCRRVAPTIIYSKLRKGSQNGSQIDQTGNKQDTEKQIKYKQPKGTQNEKLENALLRKT